MDRERLLDDVAALALGVLPADEAERVRRAIEADDELFFEYEALRGVADLVGYEAEPDAAALDEVASARMKSGVMRAVRGGEPPARRERHRRGWAWIPYTVGAAGLAAGIVAVLASLSLRQELSATERQIASLQAQVASQTKVASTQRTQLADLLSPTAKRFPVKGGQVIANDGRVYIAMQSLPKLAPGKVFQVWTLAKGAKAVAPSITFTPSADGSAIVAVPPISAPLAAVAISVEPEGGSKAPTSTPTFIRPLS